MSAIEDKWNEEEKKKRVRVSKVVCLVTLIIPSLVFIHINNEPWSGKKKKYTDVKTTKNGNENFLGQLWKKHKVVFNFESCRLLQNISHKYDLLWILYLSIFLSTECKSTSASTNDMHGRLKAVTYQIRGFLCLYFFFSNIFSCQMLLLFLAWYW